MLKIEKFEGMVAAPFTPMDSKGNLKTELIHEYYYFLQKNGIVGAFINGTTGEGASLTQKEKQLQVQKWAECLKEGGKVRIINMVGGTCINECVENALFSYEAGLSAIAVIGPYFFKPSNDSHLAEFVAQVGEAVPELPVYYYHFPAMTGVNFGMAGFISKISKMLPNFAGIKFTHEDFMDFTLCLNYNDGAYDLLWGRDECILPALATGCKGFVGSTYNFAAPLYHLIIDSFNKGDLETARRLYIKVAKMVSLLGKYGGIATGKAFIKIAGIDCGGFRPPIKNLTEEMYNSLKQDIKLLGLQEFLSKK
ncbi:MAG TPA: dihydrodipicolinate synthase family protein [Bacteroidales bacterium]|nr:dihydrodipicolinate synthetase [Bacteroidales bacterium]HOU95289.1 dihydrodipicolinate synthase family protein [Bacteroidales bacterium]HQG35625.1 dihydrodipicolinate synthase family protein [Bacteroidales bacterium]HQG51935.1 dihydrodipicolinate synthase family protein [Bacteroidales bacterium]HQJ19631.1 dihydrodipicolinate synthase family protein [Bacteroidales bacterium]